MALSAWSLPVSGQRFRLPVNLSTGTRAADLEYSTFPAAAGGTAPASDHTSSLRASACHGQAAIHWHSMPVHGDMGTSFW